MRGRDRRTAGDHGGCSRRRRGRHDGGEPAPGGESLERAVHPCRRSFRIGDPAAVHVDVELVGVLAGTKSYDLAAEVAQLFGGEVPPQLSAQVRQLRSADGTPSTSTEDWVGE